MILRKNLQTIWCPKMLLRKLMTEQWKSIGIFFSVKIFLVHFTVILILVAKSVTEMKVETQEAETHNKN